MYRTEFEANAQGFRSAPASALRHAYRVAYPSACRASIKAWLVVSVVLFILSRVH